MYLHAEDYQAFIQALEAYDKIVLYRHVRPDPDALGSQLGLKQLITAHYPHKEVRAVGTTSKGLAWLGAMDKESEAFCREALVIILDTANQERIDGQYYLQGQKIIKVDHHPKVEDFGHLQVIYPQASSTSEIIALLSQTLEIALPMEAKAARLLYAGIVGDTGRFMYNSTTSTTFAVTAWLTTFDFVAFEINDRFQLMTLNQAKFQAFLFDRLATTKDGVAFIRISIEDRQAYGISEEETNAFVNLPSRIEGLWSWVTFVEQEGDRPFWRCRIRSKGPVINTIAQGHEGGGHPMASGANAYSEEEMNAIVEELNQAVVAFKAGQA